MFTKTLHLFPFSLWLIQSISSNALTLRPDVILFLFYTCAFQVISKNSGFNRQNLVYIYSRPCVPYASPISSFLILSHWLYWREVQVGTLHVILISSAFFLSTSETLEISTQWRKKNAFFSNNCNFFIFNIKNYINTKKPVINAVLITYIDYSITENYIGKMAPFLPYTRPEPLFKILHHNY